MRGSDDMVKWLNLIGYELQELDRLKVIIISGTNGKGSTCGFTASFLQVHGRACGFPQKVGLYTSPHLKHIRERIQIDGEPISETTFAERFFEIWEKLPKTPTEELDIARYLQLLTLLSYHVFLSEDVDVAIYEPHLGGEYDATNIVPHPVVAAVSSISMDHVGLLGPTIHDIAWHKAGVFKSGGVAFSSPQETEVAAMLNRRAKEKAVNLNFVRIDPIVRRVLSTGPAAQILNCSLALKVAQAWLRAVVPETQSQLEETTIVEAINAFHIPGRYQRINSGKFEWFLDGAHNESSVQQAAQWYIEAASESQRNANPRFCIIFGHHSLERDDKELLRNIVKTLIAGNFIPHHIILTTYIERQGGVVRIDRNHRDRDALNPLGPYVELLQELGVQVSVVSRPTIEEALHLARKFGDSDGMQTLITGSLHLVSGALYLLESEGTDTGAAGVNP